MPRGSERWFTAARCAADISGRVQKEGSVRQLYDLLYPTFPCEAATAAQLLAATKLVVQLRGAGDRERADTLQARVEAAALRVPPDPAVTAHLLVMRASPRLYRQDYLGLLIFMAAAADAHEEAGDGRRASNARMNAGYAAVRIGRCDQAEELLRRALADIDRLGLQGVRPLALQNLGIVLALTDRVDEGLACEREALAEAEAQGNQRAAGGCRLYLARILLLKGDLVAAERAARQCVVELAWIAPIVPYSKAVLADVLLAAGRPREAQAVAAEGLARLEETGQIEDGEALLRVVFAESLLATSGAEAAHQAIKEALERLFAVAATLSDPSARAAFFAQVPEHARTVALAGCDPALVR